MADDKAKKVESEAEKKLRRELAKEADKAEPSKDGLKKIRERTRKGDKK